MARSPVWTGSGCSSESRACRPPSGRTCTGTDAAAQVQDQLGRQVVGGTAEPHVEQRRGAPLAGGEQRLPPGDLLPRDTPEVDRHPGHRVHLLARLSQLLQAADPDRAAPSSSSSSPTAQPAGGQRAGDDGAAAPDGERPVDPEPDAGVEVGGGQPAREPVQRGAQLGQARRRCAPTPPRPARRRARSPASCVAGLGEGRRRVGEVAAGDDQQPVRHAERVERGEVLGGLRHPALVGGDDEQRRPAPGRPRRACWRRTARARARRRTRGPRPRAASSRRTRGRWSCPRRRSSAHRSGSIPVSARTSVDLPWST